MQVPLLACTQGHEGVLDAGYGLVLSLQVWVIVLRCPVPWPCSHITDRI